MTSAHEQPQTHRYWLHFPPHPARKDDPHYVDFEHYHRKTRHTARCYIGEHIGFGECRDAQGSPCPPPGDGGQQPGLELHHAHIEFSVQNGVDLAALEKDYPGVSSPDQVGAWVESADNLRWYCVAEGTPILMPNGMTKPIEHLGVGDRVIGADSLPHKVTASRSRKHRGPIYAIEDGPSLTGGHLVLTPERWRPVASLSPADLIYRISKNSQGARPATQINVSEMQDSPAIGGQNRIASAIVCNAGAMPLHAVHLNDDLIVMQYSIRHIPADGTKLLVRHPRRVESGEQPGFQPRRAMPYCSSFAVVVITPHAKTRTVEPPVLSLRIGFSVGRRELFTASTADGGSCWGTRKCVQRRYTAGIGAVVAGTQALEMRTVNREWLLASLAGEIQSTAMLQCLLAGSGAGARTGGVIISNATRDQEIAAALKAGSRYSRPAGGCWRPVGEIRCHDAMLNVHDITVADSHSFVASGAVVHNCAWHHRGASGAHTASHSDFEAAAYVPGLITRDE